MRMIPNPLRLPAQPAVQHYPIRALICRFYLCSTLRGDTEQLIYYISSLGMTATHVFARQEGLLAEGRGHKQYGSPVSGVVQAVCSRSPLAVFPMQRSMKIFLIPVCWKEHSFKGDEPGKVSALFILL